MGVLAYFLNVSLRDFNVMKSLFNEGWSANKVQLWMSGNLTGYRRSTVQAVKREVMNMLKFEYVWKKANPEKIPHKYMFCEREYRAPFNYWIHYNVDALNEVTGEYERRRLSHFANTLKTPQDWQDEIMSTLNIENYEHIISFSNFSIINVDHQAGMTY